MPERVSEPEEQTAQQHQREEDAQQCARAERHFGIAPRLSVRFLVSKYPLMHRSPALQSFDSASSSFRTGPF